MKSEKTIQELLGEFAAMPREEQQRFLVDAWEKIERMRDLAGPELTEEEWDEIDARYNARFTSVAAHRS